MQIRKQALTMLLIAALCALAACGGTAPTGETSSSGTPSSSSGEQSSAPTEAAPTSVPVEEEQETSVENISNSLEDLPSYRMRFTFSFEGQDADGTDQSGSMEMLQEVIKETNDNHFRWSASGAAASESAQGGVVEMFQVGDTSYMYSPESTEEQKCVGFSTQETQSPMGALLKPDQLIGGVEKATLVARDQTVNGVTTDHYTFDEGGLGFGTFGSAKGDLWLAKDGNYLVKYSGTATGSNSIMGTEAEGTFTWEYNVEDVGAIEAITLPEECAGQAPATDIPVPENATEKSSFGTIITFKSSEDPAALAAFYQEQLPANGWTAGEASNLETMQMLEFTKEDRKLSVTITTEEAGGSSVLLSE